jgi:hypothetical protein
MLNSYPLYNPPPPPTTNNLRRSSLNSPISLIKYRRNSFSPSISQQTFEDLNEDYFPSSTTNNPQPKIIESNSNFDTNLSFLDGLDDNLNLPDLSTPPPIISSPQSTIQRVRIIRRNDTAPIQTNPNQRRVVRVIRLSNAARTTEQPPSSSSSSNVYIVRKTDLTPSVQINPALKHVINKTSTIDENNQINKFYGSTISIFGIEFTVVSNENNSKDKCASLVQNFNHTNIKPNIQTTNKVFFRLEKEKKYLFFYF